MIALYMRRIIGHTRQIEYLERVIARGHLVHAYLFYGPEHVGKETVARAVAKFLICPNAQIQKRALADGDDRCAVCSAIDAGTHSDVTLLGPDRTLVSANDKRKEIPIEDIRELKRRFAYAVRGGSWRIAILSDIDKMSQEAADAFLKMLEEPGARTIFFLITSARERVAATVASRAIPMGFPLVSDDALGAYLKEHAVFEEAEMPEMLALASGRAGTVLILAEDPDQKKRTRGYGRLCAEAFQNGIPGALALAQDAAENDKMRRHAVHSCITSLRARLHAASDSSERSRIAGAMGRMLDISAVMETTNVNQRLVLDILFMNYLSAARSDTVTL